MVSKGVWLGIWGDLYLEVSAFYLLDEVSCLDEFELERLCKKDLFIMRSGERGVFILSVTWGTVTFFIDIVFVRFVCYLPDAGPLGWLFILLLLHNYVIYTSTYSWESDLWRESPDLFVPLYRLFNSDSYSWPFSLGIFWVRYDKFD